MFVQTNANFVMYFIIVPHHCFSLLSTSFVFHEINIWIAIGFEDEMRERKNEQQELLYGNEIPPKAYRAYYILHIQQQVYYIYIFPLCAFVFLNEMISTFKRFRRSEEYFMDFNNLLYCHQSDTYCDSVFMFSLSLFAIALNEVCTFFSHQRNKFRNAIK